MKISDPKDSNSVPSKKSGISKLQKIIFALLVIAMVGLRVWQLHWKSADMYVNNDKLHVLVADTERHRVKGLGGRNSLGKYDGMLFVASVPDRIGIVMRDMRFPIDIVWVHRGVVVDIAPNVAIEPGVSDENLRKYYPRSDANAVIELPAGWAEAHNLKIGDPVRMAE